MQQDSRRLREISEDMRNAATDMGRQDPEQAGAAGSAPPNDCASSSDRCRAPARTIDAARWVTCSSRPGSRDWYGPYRPGPASDPLEARDTLSDRPRRVLRGGSWLKPPGDLRSAARYRNAPGSRNADNGFRVVAAVSTPAAATATPATFAAQAAQAAQPGLSYLLVPLVFGLLVFSGIAFVILKGVRGIFGDRRSPGIKPGRDGFTIVAPRARPGETIRYRYLVEGRPETGEMTVPSDPAKGMFVFTGTPPSNVEILSVLAASAAAMPGRPRGAAPPPPPPQQRRTPRRDDDDDFRGFPSAY